MSTSTLSPDARPRLFLSPPHMSAAEFAFIAEAFRSNFIAPVGPHVDAFEREFAAHFGFKDAAAVSSGTAAIHLALRMLGVKAGDEVVCSTLTFAASANPIVYEQARPVFIDSDTTTWNLDPDLLEEWLAARARLGRLPRAVVAVDLYGQCADLARVARICAHYDLPVIEDSAEALGATFQGRPAGSFGRAGIFSFNGNKIITTSGGGMLVSDDVELIARARFLATQARDPQPHYQHSQLGFNYRMSNVLAGIGRAQLQVLGERVEARRRIFARYHEGLRDLPGLEFMPEAPGSRSNRWLTCLTVDPAVAGVDRETVRRALEAANIEARAVWKPLHLQPVFDGCEIIGGAVAQRLFEHGLCLPSGSAMSLDDISRVVEIVRGVFPGAAPNPKRPAAPSTPDSPPKPAAPIGAESEKWREGLRSAVQRALAWINQNIARRTFARTATALIAYDLLLSGAFFLSYETRWDFAPPESFQAQCWLLMIPIVACKILLLGSFGQLRSILSYFGLADFGRTLLSLGVVSALMLGLWYGSDVAAAPPRGIILMDFVLSVGTICGFRLALRLLRNWSVSGVRPGLVERKVAIVGAGDIGQQFAKELLERRGCGLIPVLLVDDHPERMGRSIHGIPVAGPFDKLEKLAARLQVNELVAIQSEIRPDQLGRLLAVGRRLGASTQIVPTFRPATLPATRMEAARPVAIEDLLGRDQVDLSTEAVRQLVRNRVVLVTGAGGSIGSELCRQILTLGPSRLLMLDQAEIGLFEIEQELRGAATHTALHPVVADVADENTLAGLFLRHRPAFVFHAAAHKHVPLMEGQPAEAAKNNTYGTITLMRLASRFGVERFLLVSSDKAINPTSVMGCTKRLAEMALQAQQAEPDNPTTFLAVRFGNVLGSSGSVIPVFRRQIALGGPVTVTHPEMTRYFMTVHEAVGLLLQTLTFGVGGEIYVLDMSEPVRILDLARQMIELSGLRPGIDIKVAITGLRPGEKLFEELCHTDETHEATLHARVHRLRAAPRRLPTDWLEGLREAMDGGDCRRIKLAMQQIVPEYRPFLD